MSRLAFGAFIAPHHPIGEHPMLQFRRDIDLADACIIRMSELTRECRVVTVDRQDFSVYRRNGRDLIPLVAPPTTRPHGS